jgi:hypothetical protein
MPKHTGGRLINSSLTGFFDEEKSARLEKDDCALD